jgi:hypothetical protein
MTSLIPTPSPGFIADSIQRMRSELLHLETLCSGHYIGGNAAGDLKDMAKRLEALTQPRKGYLQHDARRLDNAA